MRDLKNPRWMYLKAALFIAIGIVSAGLILAENWQAKTVLLLALAVWSFCRAYYFAFYVIERYIDPSFKFAGLFSALAYLVQKPRFTVPTQDRAAK
jgi:hypothetical protein